MLAASGDSGAADVKFNEVTYYLHPVTSWPDSDPLVTGIGGTQLHLTDKGHTISPASVWNDTYNMATNEYIIGDKGPNPLAGGGGKSVIFGRPSYQNGVAGVVGGRRGVPDISMSGACNGAVDMYQSFKGQPAWYPTCGTSEATPLFAGVVALADQVAGHPLGLINPALYAMSAGHAARPRGRHQGQQHRLVQAGRQEAHGQGVQGRPRLRPGVRGGHGERRLVRPGTRERTEPLTPRHAVATLNT